MTTTSESEPDTVRLLLQQTDMVKKSSSSFSERLYRLESIVGPILITALSAYVRLDGIGKANKVVWDEAHFGKFGAYYRLGEFYFDVHPPMGKLLIGFSEYLAGFNGSFLFESGSEYPEFVDFYTMRVFNAVFGILVAPIAYFAAKALGFNLFTVYLISFMVTLENSFIVLSKFILLDSMLVFFTSTTYFCMIKFHNCRKNEFTKHWLTWLLLTGISIGCVCSIKWVGLFVTALVGLYTILDLALKLFDAKLSWKKYGKHWIFRIINLICVPLTIYIISFKVHFNTLYKAGSGHASMLSLFQINLENTDISPSPRDVAYGSIVTIRSHGLSPNLLHSHVQLYPDGSRQHQITTYGHKDLNNNWVFAHSRLSGTPRYNETTDKLEYVSNNDRIMLYHQYVGCNLHSHQIPGHVTKNAYEVSGYGNAEIGDYKDDWIIEIVEQQFAPSDENLKKQDPLYNEKIHPISTNFRLKHAELGCYLATTGHTYPAWGFKQGEVICKNSLIKSDKSTWWNVEDNSHDKLEKDFDFIANPPKSNFMRDFILLNFAMQANNNALVPDDDKYDHLASYWYDWIIARRGIRMSSWNLSEAKYYLFPNPFTVWFTTLSLCVFTVILFIKIFLWQAQLIQFDNESFWKFYVQGLSGYIGWFLHFLPFVIMARVTYVHHYLPSEFFAIFVSAYLVESFADYLLKVTARIDIVKEDEKKLLLRNEAKNNLEIVHISWFGRILQITIYLTLYLLTIGVYYVFSPFTQGLEGSTEDLEYIKWFDTWHMV